MSVFVFISLKISSLCTTRETFHFLLSAKKTSLQTLITWVRVSKKHNHTNTQLEEMSDVFIKAASTEADERLYKIKNQ